MPCPICGWKYSGFHICGTFSSKPPREPVRRGPTHTGPMSDSGRMGIQIAQAARRAAERDENRSRDQKIVSSYLEGVGCVGLAKEFGLAKSTILKVLHRAGVEMRARGLNDRHRKELV